MGKIVGANLIGGGPFVQANSVAHAGLINGKLAAALRREMGMADLGNKEFAAKIGRSEDTVERILRGEHVKYSTLCQVYKVFPNLETVSSL